MESVYQHRVENRRTNKYTEVKQALFSCSNAVHVASYSFAELPAELKSFLGKKNRLAQTTKRLGIYSKQIKH